MTNTYFLHAANEGSFFGLSDEARDYIKRALSRLSILSSSTIVLASSEKGARSTAEIATRRLGLGTHSHHPSDALHFYGRHPQYLAPRSLSELIGSILVERNLDPQVVADSDLLIITHHPLMRAASGDPEAIFPEGGAFEYEGLWTPPPPPPTMPIQL